MKPKHRRMVVLALAAAGLAAASGLVISALDENLVFFHSPSDIAAGSVAVDQRFRLGGLVADGSVAAEADGVAVHFDVTDTVHTIPVTYAGILPDLFREGQGVVAHGRLDAEGVFVADELLAKHDENYMPPEVHDALQRAGEVRRTEATGGADG